MPKLPADNHYPDMPKRKMVNNLPRAKLYLRARLGCLWAYPLYNDQGEWQLQQLYYPLPWDALLLDKQSLDLGNAHYSHKHMISAFPKALPRLVGDVKVWSMRVELKLQALQRCIKGEHFIPEQALLIRGSQGNERLCRQITQLRQDHPQLVSLIDSFVWWLSLEPNTLDRALVWINDEAAALGRLLSQPEGIKSAASLFALSQQMPVAQVSYLLMLMVHEVWEMDAVWAHREWVLCLLAANKETRLKKNAELLPAAQQADMQQLWRKWLQAIWTLDRKQRKQRVIVLQCLFPLDLLDEWGRWMGKVRQYHQNWTNTHAWAQHYLTSVDNYHKQLLADETVLKAIGTALQSFHDHLPALPAPTAQFHHLISDFLPYFSSLQRLQKILQQLAPEHLWREPSVILKIAQHWQAMAQSYHHYNTAGVIHLWLGYLQQAPTPAHLAQRLAPWEILLRPARNMRRIYEMGVDYEILINMEPENGHQYQTFFTHLARLCEQSNTPVDAATAAEFLDFYVSAPTEWPALVYFQALQQHDFSMTFSDLEAVYLQQLIPVPCEAEEFIAIVRQFELADEYQRKAQKEHLLVVAAGLIQHSYQVVVSYVMVAPDNYDFGLLANLIRTWHDFKKTLPAPQAVMEVDAIDWANYPARLYPALRLLQMYHPKAGAVATRILGKDLPSDDVLQQQIIALQQRLHELHSNDGQHHAMQQRLLSLQQRLQAPKTVSKARLQTLEAKLQHAAIKALLTRWQADLKQEIYQYLASHLYCESLPLTWLEDEQKLRALMALARAHLNAAQRQLAGQLLQANLAGTYPDLRDEAPNQAWLRRMQDKGINTAAWLEGVVFHATATLANGEPCPLVLRFVNDFFSILPMGEYFDTCLSYHGCNFFSVLANAADINKRVVYAYDVHGKVIGRCLLAISDQGDLLHFHPYSHLPSDIFIPVMQQFISYLEEVLQLQRNQKGHISRLLAHDWYDDGIVTLLPDYPVLQPSSDFRQQLGKLADQDIFSALQQAIYPKPLTAMILLTLMDMPELHERPRALIHTCEQALAEGLVRADVIKALVECLLKRQVPYELIWPLAKTWMYEHVHHIIRDNKYFPDAEMHLLIEMHPASVLKLVRKFMVYQNNYYSHYNWVLHLYYQARAQQQLKRYRQAANTYQYLLSRSKEDDDEAFVILSMQEQIKQLLAYCLAALA